jgi:hypothetical protein
MLSTEMIEQRYVVKFLLEEGDNGLSKFIAASWNITGIGRCRGAKCTGAVGQKHQGREN